MDVCQTSSENYSSKAAGVFFPVSGGLASWSPGRWEVSQDGWKGHALARPAGANFSSLRKLCFSDVKTRRACSVPWEGVRNGKIISSLLVSSRAEVEAVSVVPLAKGRVSAVQSQPEQPAGKISVREKRFVVTTTNKPPLPQMASEREGSGSPGDQKEEKQ